MERLRRIARKLRRIAGSELARRDLLRYAFGAAGLGGDGGRYRLRGGGSLALRKGTTDTKVFDEIFVERVYAEGLASRTAELGRVTLIDLGAYTGLSALFFARELGVEEIIAVEPDPDNFRMLSQNLETSGLAARCTPVHAFAGAGRAFAEVRDSGNGAWGMRMGPLADSGTPVLPLAEIAGLAKSSRPIVLKCDIEGGERHLFPSIREWEHLVHCIFLELHTEFFSVADLRASLESSGFEWTVHGSAEEGASIAFFLLERGLERGPERGEKRGGARAARAHNATMKHVCL